MCPKYTNVLPSGSLAKPQGMTKGQPEHRTEGFDLGKWHTKFLFPSIKATRYDLQEKRRCKCQCKFECNLNPCPAE